MSAVEILLLSTALTATFMLVVGIGHVLGKNTAKILNGEPVSLPVKIVCFPVVCVALISDFSRKFLGLD